MPKPLTTETMTRERKRRAARAALAFVHYDQLLGVGTGSTVDCFIDALAASGVKIRAAISSSAASSAKLRANGISVSDADNYEKPDIYIDGADEVDPQLCLIKGGGGALTREKILAQASPIFVCIADQSKLVPKLGEFPLPIEVVPAAANLIIAALASLSGRARKRSPSLTENGGIILDVNGLSYTDPLTMEKQISMIPGVITVGIFAQRRADVLLLGTDCGVKTYHNNAHFPNK